MLLKRLKYCFLIGITTPILANPSIPTTITSKNIEELAFYPQHDAPATAISLNDAIISSELTGIIQNIPYQVADYVTQDSALVQLDCQDYQLSYQQAKASLKATKAQIALAEWQLNKVKSLANQHNVSQESVKQLDTQLITHQATLDSQRSSLRAAARQTARCQVKAPFDGVIVERFSSKGEQAKPGTHLLRLVDINNIELSAQLLPGEIESIKKANALYFENKDGTFPVTLRAAVPTYQSNSRTQELRGYFHEKKPLPGSIGRLVWQDSIPHLPANLLSQYNHELGFFVEQQEKAIFVPIEQAKEGRPIPVPSHIRGNIILDGRYRLTHGMPVSKHSS